VKYIFSTVLLSFLFLSTQSCKGPVKSNSSDISVVQETESPRQTIRKAMRASVWRFVYCLEEGVEDEGLVRLLNEMAAKQPFEKRIEVVSCEDISTDSLGAGPLTLFGNRLPEGAESLPVGKDGAAWRLAPNKTFTDQDVLLLPYFQNPWSGVPTVAGFFLSDDLGDMNFTALMAISFTAPLRIQAGVLMWKRNSL